MTVGERIKDVRNKLNMSQVAFADKINVSKQTLYKYENNLITNIPSDKIEAVAKLGNVSPAYLMGWKTTVDYSLKINETDEILLIECYRSLPEDMKKRMTQYASMLTQVHSYEEPVLNAAHARTDIEFPEDVDTSDDDIMDDDNF